MKFASWLHFATSTPHNLRHTLLTSLLWNGSTQASSLRGCSFLPFIAGAFTLLTPKETQSWGRSRRNKNTLGSGREKHGAGGGGGVKKLEKLMALPRTPESFCHPLRWKWRIPLRLQTKVPIGTLRVWGRARFLYVFWSTDASVVPDLSFLCPICQKMLASKLWVGYSRHSNGTQGWGMIKADDDWLHSNSWLPVLRRCWTFCLQLKVLHIFAHLCGILLHQSLCYLAR